MIDFKLDGLYRRAYSLVSNEPEQKEWYEEWEEEICSMCPSLSIQQRLSGCLICMTIGFLISMGSTFRLVQLLKGDPEPFAVMYTIGNILGLFSTCFLYGPFSQVKKMFATTRLIATIIYCTFMTTTLFLAFYPGDIPGRVILLVFSIFFQFMALVWYTLSYIPFARQAVTYCCRQFLCGCGGTSSNEDDGWFA